MKSAASMAKKYGEPHTAYRCGPHWLIARKCFVDNGETSKIHERKDFYPPEDCGKTLIPGHVEVDPARGVIYFHTNETSIQEDGFPPTILRICNLGDLTDWDCKSLLDVTNKIGATYERRK